MALSTQFYRDLEAAKTAEKIVFDSLSSSGYNVEDVSNDREYWYKGDIKLTSSTGEVFFIEVKDDGRIADTGNVLCEHQVYYKEGNYCEKGNMFCDSDILAVVSKKEQKIYFIDFHILKEKYKQGTYKEIDHPAQTTYCYLVDLATLTTWKAILGKMLF